MQNSHTGIHKTGFVDDDVYTIKFATVDVKNIVQFTANLSNKLL